MTSALTVVRLFDTIEKLEGCVMAAVADDLTMIRGAVTGLAFAMVDETGKPNNGFTPLLESLDLLIDRWSEDVGQSNEDYYKLGLTIGVLSHMAACRVDADGELVPVPMIYPEDSPVAQAAEGIRAAVLMYTAPTN